MTSRRSLVFSNLQSTSIFTTRIGAFPALIQPAHSVVQYHSTNTSSRTYTTERRPWTNWHPRTGIRGITSATYQSTSLKGLRIQHQVLDRRKSFGRVCFTAERFAYTSAQSRRVVAPCRNKSDATRSRVIGDKGSNISTRPTHGGSSKVKDDATSTTNKPLMERLPSIPHMHRPTKEELLAAATGFWSRLKVRFKWFSIRSVRPFNADDISAFFSWVLLGHVLWIILGTTTFFSLAIFAVNTVFAQETLARWVGNYLTQSSGIKVVFESAIVPKWGDGVITFKNVYVSRRPGQGKGKVSKGSPETAAAVAKATQLAEQWKGTQSVQEEEDVNYTQFDISLETVNVTLSFTKWFNSKGLLRDVEVKGVRGVIDRTHVHYNGEYVDPRSYKHKHSPGDFEIDSFKMEDLLVTVYQPKGFRPFSVSIFSCDLPQLRRQWLFYDFLSANMMSGSFDDSLFTIHPRQMHGHTGSELLNSTSENGAPSPWKKHSRIRIDGLNIDHLNRGVEGPFSWIHQGNVDIVADIMFPTDNDESLAKVMSSLYERIEAEVTARPSNHTESHSVIIKADETGDGTPIETYLSSSKVDDDKRFLVMDIRIHLNDVRATVPVFTRDLSYVNNALIRPIVAYINSRHTFIPINCRVVKRASEFDGSWTIFDSGLMGDLSAEVKAKPIFPMFYLTWS